MSMSNEIAKLILDMLSDDGETEIQRNEMAQHLGCVPSQINYVIYRRKQARRRRIYQDYPSEI